jgi:hypothetical protein
MLGENFEEQDFSEDRYEEAYRFCVAAGGTIYCNTYRKVDSELIADMSGREAADMERLCDGCGVEIEEDDDEPVLTSKEGVSVHNTLECLSDALESVPLIDIDYTCPGCGTMIVPSTVNTIVLRNGAFCHNNVHCLKAVWESKND